MNVFFLLFWMYMVLWNLGGARTVGWIGVAVSFVCLIVYAHRIVTEE